MRLILFLVLVSCNQRSVLPVPTKTAEGRVNPECISPSPLCPEGEDPEGEDPEGEDPDEETDEGEGDAGTESGTSQPAPEPTDEPNMASFYYGGSSNQFRLMVSPATIAKDKLTKLTITIKAVMELENRGKSGRSGVQRTYDLWIAGKATSDSKRPDKYYLASSPTVSDLTPFVDAKNPRCNINGNNAAFTQCTLKIKAMQKDDSFEVYVMVAASEEFAIGNAKNTQGEPLIIKVN
ncbi:MAG: hypothetical protein OYH77_04855 [Pseudomonadota bacterium]|nr:hypothetical protein [Pseudomonadota bacterium]